MHPTPHVALLYLSFTSVFTSHRTTHVRPTQAVLLGDKASAAARAAGPSATAALDTDVGAVLAGSEMPQLQVRRPGAPLPGQGQRMGWGNSAASLSVPTPLLMWSTPPPHPTPVPQACAIYILRVGVIEALTEGAQRRLLDRLAELLLARPGLSTPASIVALEGGCPTCEGMRTVQLPYGDGV